MSDITIPGVSFRTFGEGKMGPMVQSYDWAKTSLGPIGSWPKSLKTHVSMMLALPTPAIIFWGEEQVQIYNDGYSVIMGPRHPDHLGSTFRECWAEAYPTIDPWMKRVTRNAEVVIVERSPIPLTRYGFIEECYFTFTFSPLRDDDGKIGGLLQIVTEVTESVLSVRRLDMLRKISPGTNVQSGSLQNFIDAVSSNPKDIRFALIFLTEGPAIQLKHVASIGVGEQIADLPGFSQLMMQVRDAFSTGTIHEIKDVQTLIPHAPIEPWTELTRDAAVLSVQVADLASPKGVVVFGISPRLKLNEQYRSFLIDATRAFALALETDEQKIKDLEKTLRLRDEFLSIASHELRTPLTALHMQLQLIEKIAKKEPTDKKRLISLSSGAFQASQQLVTLLDELLDITRIRLAKLNLHKKEVDLKAAAIQGVAAISEEARQKGSLVTVKADRSVVGMWDPARILQIISNLLSNAIKYGEGKPIEVVVALNEKASRSKLLVRDQGRGISREMHSKIFERFERGVSGTEISGLGLGLYIVRRIVEAHGGTVGVESEPGKGSLFIVELPLLHEGQTV